MTKVGKAAEEIEDVVDESSDSITVLENDNEEYDAEDMTVVVTVVIDEDGQSRCLSRR